MSSISPESTVASTTEPTGPAEPASEPERGRQAQSPTQIPWAGWKDVVWRAYHEVGSDRVLDVAASVAFYGLLALYPALLATISMYGLLSDPTDVIRQANQLSVALPSGARSAVMNQMLDIARTSPTGLGLGLLLSLAAAFLSASSGLAALMRGLNAVYDERDTRGWVRVRLIALSFTMSLSLFVIISVSTITLLPTVLERIGLGRAPLVLVRFSRWPTLALATVACLAILYRHAPNRTPARWKWVAPGSILATLIWTVGSFAFGIYVENFGRFNRTYGTIGGAVVLSLWMYMSALAILLGAELNAELERQTEVDSTVGPPRPMGERAASVADHLGPPRPDLPARGIRQALTDTVSNLNRHGKREGQRLRFLYQLGPNLEEFTALTALRDARVALGYLGQFKRCAVVSSLGWVQKSVKLAGTVLPCEVRVYPETDLQQATNWLAEATVGRNLSHQLLVDLATLVVEPTGRLEAEDFEALAATVDPWLRDHGKLRGLVIRARKFPGWQDFRGLLGHLRFVHGHRAGVRRVAIASDGKLVGLAQKLADRFASAEVAQFRFDELDAAVKWASAEPVPASATGHDGGCLRGVSSAYQ